jgi:RND family efflux transporter MFP subunit
MVRTLLATLAAALLAAGCGRSEKGPTTAAVAAAAPATGAANDTPVSVRFAVPEKVRYAPRVVVSGTLKARQSAPLAFAAGGPLALIAVRRGQEVAAGQLLGALVDVIPSAQKKQAEAAVAAAKVQLALAEDGLKRVEAIRAQDGMSEAQVFQTRSQRDLAAAQLTAAEAQLQQAVGNLDHHYLRAPFAGVVTRIPEGVGVTVGPGVPLFALASTRSLFLDTSVTQDQSAELRSGLRVAVTVPATGARTTEAIIQVVVGAVDPASSRVPVEISVANGDGRFLANAYARAEFPQGAERDGYRIPSGALLQREGAYAAWVAGADGRVRALPVRLLGEEEDTAVVVPTGDRWPEGARVVLAPSTGLSEGMRVAEVAR